MSGLFDKRISPKKRLIVISRSLQAGWLLAGLSVFAAQADIGPALSGLTARADSVSTVFTSPAGITRLRTPIFFQPG
jgi:hypothetical protein